MTVITCRAWSVDRGSVAGCSCCGYGLVALQWLQLVGHCAGLIHCDVFDVVDYNGFDVDGRGAGGAVASIIWLSNISLAALLLTTRPLFTTIVAGDADEVGRLTDAAA